MTTTKQRPILFSAPMVRTLLDGTKTQTRRVCKPAVLLSHVIPISDPNATEQRPPNMTPGWFGDEEGEVTFKSPFGVPGDQLWVRETFMDMRGGGINHDDSEPYRYRAEFELPKGLGLKWKPSIFMPRAASRITLEITSVRVERLQDISADDARREGIPNAAYSITPIESYKTIWEDINGAGSWDLNPWVWVIEFKKVKP